MSFHFCEGSREGWASDKPPTPSPLPSGYAPGHQPLELTYCPAPCVSDNIVSLSLDICILWKRTLTADLRRRVSRKTLRPSYSMARKNTAIHEPTIPVRNDDDNMVMIWWGYWVGKCTFLYKLYELGIFHFPPPPPQTKGLNNDDRKWRNWENVDIWSEIWSLEINYAFLFLKNCMNWGFFLLPPFYTHTPTSPPTHTQTIGLNNDEDNIVRKWRIWENVVLECILQFKGKFHFFVY